MTMAPRRPIPRLLTALITAALACAAGAQDNVRLPDLGSSANALISPQEAQDYGASMLRQMRALDMVVDDPLLDDYINDLGYRLAASSDKPKEHFTFFVVKDQEINAFAAPGGYIAVNAGLMTITRDESELAGVIAHEIGHITQNHLQRAFEDSRKDAPLMALVLLGAIVAGAGGHGGDAPMAVLAGGQGLIAQKSINFTRKDEIEADRVGIQTLAKAGFDPNAMAGFFQRMQDAMSAGAGGEDVPALLQTHPVTTMRISDAKARAGALAAAQKLRPSGTAMDKLQWEKSTAPIAFVKDPATLLRPSVRGGLDTYALMRERVRVLAGDATKLATYYSASLQSRPDFDTPANRYGYALALTRSGRGAIAAGELQPLLQSHPDNLILKLALADARLQAGQHAAALAMYTELNTQSPRNRAVALAYAKALTAGGDKAQASLAANLLRPLLDDASEPEVYSAYARASEKAGDSVRAGEAFADASYYSGRPFDAMEQLKRLLKRDDLDYYARARIQARISELTPLVLELHKRKIKTEDNPDGRQQQLRPDGGCDSRLCFSLGAGPDGAVRPPG
ncbi:M48 family peptidase [Rhodanobacter denitrificans]|uniref:Putative beta-barrel assembly-enhancing protease n=1 Tax=Rhodanobacter denitrificans TaxID=666685 RepID=A0A368KDI2_9GAMM|nr:M48 family metalloprotease [Rhodanobacter denitrificans]RCS28723.1 M48 family peptidase [Rhodanobacter denitrificans]